MRDTIPYVDWYVQTSRSTWSPTVIGMIDFDPERAVWRQVASDIRAKISSEEYAPGSRLPSETDLSAWYGVSRTTIRAVINNLKGDGLVVVEQRPGRPRATYVTDPAELATVTLGPGDTMEVRGGTVVVNRATGASETYRSGAVRVLRE